MPAKTPLDPDTILAATEQILRRHGPAKATVVDVARSLGVSHAAVYRHFASKQQLREAVARRWLDRNRDELATIAADRDVAPPLRVRRWLHALLAGKRAKIEHDPELFHAYGALATGDSTIADEHVGDLIAQLERIVADGVADGSFDTDDPAAATRALFLATARFHHIAHASDWLHPDIDAELDAVCTLLLRGLQTRTSPKETP